MKINVVIVLPFFKTGGAEKMVSLLVSNLDKSRFEVTVICIFGQNQKTNMEKRIIAQGVRIEYLNKGLGFSIKTVLKVWKILNVIDPDLIHTHTSGCIYTAPWILFHKVKMLHTIHNMPVYEAENIRRYMMYILFHIRKAIPVAISKENQILTANYYHLAYQQIEMICNPVQTSIYRKTKRDNDSREIIRFINIGRLTKQKNQKILLTAMAEIHIQHPDICLTIVGDGPEKAELMKTTERFHMESYVIFTGDVEDVEKYLSESDIFILPSIYEGLPLSILEAMASGLPVIASNVGGIPDIVKENGILVSVNDVNGLIKAAQKLIDSPIIRQEMSFCSLALVKQFDISIIAEQYSKLYEKYAKIEVTR
ncbi:MAG: glycosyltransferase [Flexilinea sp.]